MRRAAQKEATRQRIVEAARSCFDEVGFERTTISHVAATAEVSVGSVMAHFLDKPSLLAAAYHDPLQAVMDEAFASLPEGDVHDRLQHVAAALYRFYLREPGRDLLRETLFLGGEHGEAFQAQLSELTARITELMRHSRIQRPPDWAALGFFADWLGMLIAGLNGAFPDIDAQLSALDGLTRLRLK